MKDKQISVQVYRKTKTGWQYWKTMEFSHFKYFVEKFITGLLERGYKRYKGILYIPLKKMKRLIDLEALHNDKEGLIYVFEINGGELEWIIDFIETWEISKNQEKKEPLDKT